MSASDDIERRARVAAVSAAVDGDVRRAFLKLSEHCSRYPLAARLVLADLVFKLCKLDATFANVALARAPAEALERAALGQLEMILESVRAAFLETYGDAKGNA